MREWIHLVQKNQCSLIGFCDSKKAIWAISCLSCRLPQAILLILLLELSSMDVIDYMRASVFITANKIGTAASWAAREKIIRDMRETSYK